MASPATERAHSVRTTLVLILAIIAPSVFLSVLALRAIETGRRNLENAVEQETERTARGLAELLNRDLDGIARRLEPLATLPERVDDDAAGPPGEGDAPLRKSVIARLRELLEDAELPLDSPLIFDGDGERAHPPTLARLRAAQGRAGPLPAEVAALIRHAEAAEFEEGDQMAAMLAYEQLQRYGALNDDPVLRAEALIALGRVYSRIGYNDMNEYEAYQSIIMETKRVRGLDGAPLDLGARLQLAETFRRVLPDNRPRWRNTLLELLDVVRERRDELTRDEIELYVEEAARRLLEEGPEIGAQLEPYRRLARERGLEDERAGRLESAFRSTVLPWAARTPREPRFFQSAGGPGSEPLIAIAVALPSIREGAARRDGGAVVLRFDTDRFLAGRASRIVGERSAGGDRRFAIAARGADRPIVGRETWESVADEGEVRPDDDPARVRTAPLGYPLEHLEVWARTRSGLHTERLRRSGETMTFWTIVLAVGGILVGAFWATRAVAREVRIAQQKTDFVSNVTHELKTPLTSIGMFIETLEMDRIDSDEERRAVFEMLARERDRLAGLIDRLLSFSRIEAGRYRYEFQFVSPRELLESALERFRHELQLAQRPPVDVELVCVQEVGQILGDRDALEEVFLNLLHNAEKYSPGPEKTIRVTLTERRRQVSVDVEDDGIGVPRRDRKRIFKKFERGTDRAMDAIGGSGIGLTLALSIARAHGGDIRYAPGRGKGSKFTVVLPKPRRVARKDPSTET